MKIRVEATDTSMRGERMFRVSIKKNWFSSWMPKGFVWAKDFDGAAVQAKYLTMVMEFNA